MAIRLGDEAPDFNARTTEGDIGFHEYLGDSWGILFSHPADYTPVCTTELGRTAQLKEEFAKRNVKVMAVSVDPIDKHHGWVNDINETQATTVNFPIIADEAHALIEKRYPSVNTIGKDFPPLQHRLNGSQLGLDYFICLRNLPGDHA